VYKNGLSKPFLEFNRFYQLVEYTFPEIAVNEGVFWVGKTNFDLILSHFF
jgi:hypothetical protein